jgi:translation initiation factor 1 (eIF-1/SUI1)
MESEEKYKFKELAKKTQQNIKIKKIQDNESYF